MSDKKITKAEAIVSQLKLIANTNKMIESSKKVDSPLMVRQYEHLKKQFTKNLLEMLMENYQITIPTAPKKEAA